MVIYADMCTNSTTLGLAVACILIFLAYDLWQKLYFRRNGIPGPFPLPLFGTMLSTRKGFTESYMERRKQYGKVFGINLRDNVLVISDVKILQDIMISKFSTFMNRGKALMEDRPLNKGLTLLRDEHWKSVRNMLTPAFTANKMKQMVTIMNETCDQLMESFESHRKKQGGIQCKDLFGAYSMDVVASVFFGLKVDSLKNPDDPFVKHAKEAFQFSIFSPKLMAAFLVPGAGKLFDLLGISFFPGCSKKFFLDVVSRTLELRKKGDNTRADILQMMADAHVLDSTGEDGELNGITKDQNNHSKKALKTDEIMANAMIFFLAGYETTNTALCYTSYLLATHPEYQERLIQEVDQFAPTRDDLSYEVLGKMEYLDCFVRESLRIFPPISIADRSNGKEDIVVQGLLIPRNCRIFVPIYVIHRDPELWEEPEVFNPERFNKENRKNIHPMSWLPFGDGPRNCIGMRLAMMEIKFALVRLLQEFTLETCSETEIPPVMNTKSAFTCPPNGVKLNVVPRKKTE